MISMEPMLTDMAWTLKSLYENDLEERGRQELAWVRGLQKRPAGEARIWAKDPPGLTLPLPGHVILAQSSLSISQSSCVICKMRIVIIHTSQRSRKDQTGEKGCEKNYVNCKALHKEGSYDLLIPSQSAFQRKLNKLPQTFHSQGYFYFVIFQASK